ncbi:MAG: hypothetical protein HQM16_08505 [Deltaproteobacteria bacterium]|nr:hypothetical protein [Deltaproteobacteria bacterium]
MNKKKITPDTSICWSQEDLEQLEAALSQIPTHHIDDNPFLNEITRDGVLTQNTKQYPTTAGIYLAQSQKIILYNACFGPAVSIAKTRCDRTGLVLSILVGHSLLRNFELGQAWAEQYYPVYNTGRGSAAHIKLVDLSALDEDAVNREGTIFINPKTVSLDRHFALCYAFFIHAPRLLAMTDTWAYECIKRITGSV